MRKRIFSPRLYLDGLKQLRLIGIAGLVILALEAILIPVGEVLSQMDREYVSVELVGFMNMHPMLVLCFCVLAPLMTLYLFQFLNKRNASDFYHAIPETRLCLFFSFTAAILTWVVGTAVLTTLLSVGIHMAFPTFFTVNFTSVFAALMNILAGCVLVTACVALAMCVTGTVFTNVMVSLMIIFLPRLLILLLNSSVTSNLPLIASNHFVFWLDPSCNVPVGTVLGVLGIGASQNVLSSWQSGLYTLVLAMLYLGAAAFLFHRRKSEAAGRAAPNRILQAVFRIALAMVPCAIACYGIFYNIIWEEEMDTFMFVVLYIIALVVYFLYEIITTRKWKNLLKAIPALGVLVVLNVALTGGMLGLYQSSLAFSPDAEDIRSVRIMSRYQYTDYFTARTQQIEIDDPEVKEVVARQLRFSADLCRQSLRQYYDRVGPNMTTACVAIRTGTSTHYRNILLSTEDYKTLSAPLSQVPAFREIYQNLPRLGFDSTTVYMPQNSLPYATVQSIYKKVCDEVAAMPFEQWYAQIASQNQNGIYYDRPDQSVGSPEIREYGYLDMLTVSTTIGTQRYDFNLPLYTNLTESCNLYLEHMQDLEKADAEAILQKLQGESWRSDDRLTLEAFNLEGGRGQSQTVGVSGVTMADNADKTREFAALLEQPQPLDVTKPLYRITLEAAENFYDGRGGYYPSYVIYTAFFQAADDQLPALFTEAQEDPKAELDTEVYTQVVSTIQR